jgi:hypothetical protein
LLVISRGKFSLLAFGAAGAGVLRLLLVMPSLHNSY